MAAGLGFKTFTTGEVLTAADTNGYLMQGVLVFASAAARDAAITSPQEGQCCYLKDTDAVLTYSGAAWVGFDDSNAIQNTIVDAKGDIVAASGSDTPARLAVGNNGETLVADSSATTGLRWQGDYAAGKNKIINGDFYINQRALTSTTSNGGYGFDRWATSNSDGTTTYSAETFTLGTAPVAGYEGKSFARMVTTGQTATSAFSILQQKIEDVRTFAGQTVTVSFWAKAGSGTPNVAIELQQHFGTGGSPSSSVNTALGKVAITTSWARYSATVAVPSISGKILGTANDSRLTLDLFTSAGSDFNARSSSLGIQSATIDFWGVQVEAGSTATAFQTATGTLQGELAACQRYYVRFISTGGSNPWYGQGTASSATAPYFAAVLPVYMRTSPTVLDVLNLQLMDGAGSVQSLTSAAINSGLTNTRSVVVTATGSSLTVGAFYWFRGAANTDYIGFGAEL